MKTGLVSPSLSRSLPTWSETACSSLLRVPVRLLVYGHKPPVFGVIGVPAAVHHAERRRQGVDAEGAPREGGPRPRHRHPHRRQSVSTRHVVARRRPALLFEAERETHRGPNQSRVSSSPLEFRFLFAAPAGRALALGDARHGIRPRRLLASPFATNFYDGIRHLIVTLFLASAVCKMLPYRHHGIHMSRVKKNIYIYT